METKEVKEREADTATKIPEKETTEAVETGKRRSISEDEIDLAELIKKVWDSRKIVFIAAGAAFILGVFIALISPEEYESNTTLLPESSSTAQSNRGASLMRQFGGFFDMGGAGQAASLGTNMYPNITQSTPFYLHIMDQTLYFSSLDTTVTVLQYFSEIKEKPLIEHIERYTIGLPNLIISLPERWFKKKKPPSSLVSDNNRVADSLQTGMLLKLTSQQNSVMNELKKRVTTTIEKDGTVNITTEMPDPYAAAQLAQLAVDYLTQYVTEYRTEKVQQDLDFTEKQFAEAEKRFLNAQERLALFRDRNTNIVTARAQTELERFQTEFNLTASVYQSLAQQLEQAKIKVQEETPVFKELEPVQIPLKESTPNRKLIILAFIFLGVVVGFGIIFGKIFFNHVKENFFT